MIVLLDIFTFIVIPLIAIVIDGLIAIKSRNITYKFANKYSNNFTVLVPIYGNTKYLENIEYLKKYGSKVVLCTTGDETKEFYDELRAIAKNHKFTIFKDTKSTHSKVQTANTILRATSGTTRDRLIRNALFTQVKTKYVVPIDADTKTTKSLSLLVGELVHRKLDLASIKLVLTNRNESFLTHLQYHEYKVAMQLRYIFPWMVSGACHVAKTEVLKTIMAKHSLFFQGNDMEVGIIASAQNYTVGHIPFEVSTAVPATIKAWYRQRLAWAGGEFRLFIPNFSFVLHHTYLWLYGGIVVIVLFPLRWFTLLNPGLALVPIFSFYFLLVLILHWKSRDRWLILIPLYSMILSLIITPLGILWYFVMVTRDKNFGIILPRK